MASFTTTKVEPHTAVTATSATIAAVVRDAFMSPCTLVRPRDGVRRASVPGVSDVTDVVEMGVPDPAGRGAISYSVGPAQVRRVLGVLAAPCALGIAALALSLASLIIVDASNEIGDVHAISHGASTTLDVYRWSTGIRMGIAALAVVLALVGIRRVLGRRPRLTVEPADFESDERSVDDLEAEALAQVVAPPTWLAGLLGSSLIVSLVALGINASAFGYAMASHVPAPHNGFSTF